MDIAASCAHKNFSNCFRFESVSNIMISTSSGYEKL